MINRISKFAVSVIISGMFTGACHAQSDGRTVNYGHFDGSRSIDGMIGETNQAIAPGAARISGSWNQDRSDPAKFKVAFSLHPTTLCSPADSFWVYQNSGSSPVYISRLFAGDYEFDRNTEGLLPTQEVKTLFYTRSSMPLVQLWGGRLRLDGFMGTINMQNVQLGPSGSGGLRDFRPPREISPHGPRSIDLYGVSVNIHLGRDASMERPPEVRRTLSKLIGNILS